MQILSDNGLAAIKNFEGLRLNAYQDIAGVWTIGYGSTRYANGQPVKQGDTLTDQTEADSLFADTLTPYENAVCEYVKVPLNQNQFDALVSFCYNEGTGALSASTLLKKLNSGDYQGAADQFLVWDEITDPSTHQHVVAQTLAQRRKEERGLFLEQ